ncbi:MAG TPA: hypothetical protein VIN61_16185 [Gammaproteobacteria bacterium]
MTLTQLIVERRRVPLQLIAADKALAVDLQNHLTEMGLLDPPADGIFATVSHWALSQALKKLDAERVSVLDAALARDLIAAAESPPFPLNHTDTFAGRLVAAMLAAGHWICRHPDCVKKLDPRGAARIAFGQYKAWSVGTHMAGKPSAHEALVQTAPIRVHRDLNEDFERVGDQSFEGVFGINQHWGYDLPKSDIGKAGAGCLVGRTKSGHRRFMQLCKADARYVANHGYRFMTAVLPAEAVPGE